MKEQLNRLKNRLNYVNFMMEFYVTDMKKCERDEYIALRVQYEAEVADLETRMAFAQVFLPSLPEAKKEVLAYLSKEDPTF